ncbi:GntR family transcriptional regulator [Brevibacillus fluminis]|uniref:GntR family transcriptional regulator n=1 Tax=Brevibacillus fluminis TaxID=511487 RepID=A0A3M8DFY5_9BACL|nr:GntR family transcriptional regulator [Brevibacillus fluminis]RNB86906.1 GntR family transcriptional regulator [Brevibacillus fluminis]
MTIGGNYQSLKDHVYKFIATQIQNGTLLPNQKVNEAMICQKLEVSRTPVREALIQLASENLLEYRPRRGFLVKELKTKEKLDVLEIVGSLDALAAKLATDHVSEDDLLKMEALIERIDRSIKENNYADYQKYQTLFHEVYIQKCNNPSLISILESLQNSFIRQSYLSNDQEKLAKILMQMNEEHKHILALFRQKDKNGLVDFIQNTHWNIEYPELM